MTPSSNNSPNISPDNTRGIVAFPAIGDFYDELMDRINMVLDQFFLKEKFTIFINALPRDHEEGTKKYIDRFEKVPLIYAGILRQRQFLEGETKENRVQELDYHWDLLKTVKEFNENDTKVSFTLYKEFEKGDYELSDIQDKGIGTLEDYFNPKLHPELNLKSLTLPQEAEYEILNHHFNLANYGYLSVPLIQFAEFDGVVHIILSKKDYEDNFVDKRGIIIPKFVGNVIKAFSREYEGLILDWDIVGGAGLKAKSFTDASDVATFYKDYNNPILKELGYLEYYNKHKLYFADRLKYSKQIPADLRQQYRQTAIMHILIDSYAHNISAHSLTALEWWFRQRADLLDRREEAPEKEKDKVKAPADMNPKVALIENYEAPLDTEVHPLLRFLLDKGAFWTGLTRDNSFGGRIRNLYDVLWEDFVNNPLYLGTIAFTEGIVKINLNITFLEYENHEKHLRIRKKVLLDGNFVQIDLTQFHKIDTPEGVKRISEFIIKGEAFNSIAERLKQCDAFFPGGVVGVHAFFTILETELRNVKHYSETQLKIIRTTGLTLNLSVEEDHYHLDKKNNYPSVYYKIGVWLKHPIVIDKALIMKRPELLRKDIIEEETYIPRLGGTFQDKVCAAMLFNNSFTTVEIDSDKMTKRDEQFYPWVKTGSSKDIDFKTGDTIEDFEISVRRLFPKNGKFADFRSHFEATFQPHTGYLKKFFHIWKGETIYEVQNIEHLNSDWENISRFRFVYVPVGEERDKLFQQVREAGIVRIIHEKTDDPVKAYYQWLKKWLKPIQAENNYVLEFIRGKGVSAQIELDNTAIIFRNDNLTHVYTPGTTQEINLIHSSNQKDDNSQEAIRYRNHGTFKQYFCNGEELVVTKMEGSKTAELLEVLATHICIFDNRISTRFKEVDTAIFTQQMYCTIHGETESQWEAEKKGGFFRYHFLVVHLSFIESFRDEKGNKKYNEEDIQEFINWEILDGGKQEVPENFMLVITTGRGRTQWWNKLKTKTQNAKPDEPLPPYTSFVTFRPVESLTAAIESAISLKDDIELKYRLVKVLFGS